MALKDHITDAAKLTEQDIEGIIADYLKYDPVNGKVVLLPKTRDVTSEKRILLYLVALRGWPFVVDEHPPASNASPKEIELATSVRGNTLRPILRELVQSMMLGYQKGRYEMPAHNLGRVREIMSSRGNAFTGRHGPASGKEKNENSGPLAGKKTSRNKPSLGEAFEKLVNTSWFGEGKTISQLKEKLEEMAVIVPTSRLPVYLLKAVGSKPQRLTRNKVDIDGKKVWLYSTK